MFKNMVAVVTGSVNGLGRKTTIRLLDEGCSVVGCDIRPCSWQPSEAVRDNFMFERADVRKDKDVQNVIHRTMERFGHINYLVNCAGIASPHKTYIEATRLPMTRQDFEIVLNINVVGTFNFCCHAAKEMAKNDPDMNGCRGVIVNTSGFPSKCGTLGQSSTAAAGGAVNSMTLPMARDLGDVGIRVATISPGIFETPLTSSLDRKVQELVILASAFPHRLGHPTEFTDLVFHIFQNNMINGEVLEIDGGFRSPGNV